MRHRTYLFTYLFLSYTYSARTMSWVRYVCTCSWSVSTVTDSPKLVAGRRAWWRQRSRDTGCGHHRVDVDCRWRWRRALDGSDCCRFRRGCRFWRHRDPTSPTWSSPSDLLDTSAASTFPRRRPPRELLGWNLHCRQQCVNRAHTGWARTYWQKWHFRTTLKRPFCTLALLDPRIGHAMDVLSPLISVLCHSDWLFHGEFCPHVDVVHSGRAWSSSSACTWHSSLHYHFLQATLLFPHGVTTVC